ncbi:protein TadE [Pasteurella multocida]|uniref:TadE-like protein n=1 Tax=Pasteurella dagmatis ATCC 43325 TaxID=667128 RepID=C9PRL1_9PAST|nr:TadE family protein [Pasteurella dagmatis]EEX49588.1 TadE-like protein [Pasteurella dagmatis ATCC 43325]SNV62753.1 protein TadE [Pasteurella dagmatis]VEI57439.1 protein TadE [Pasteurella multocida]
MKCFISNNKGVSTVEFGLTVAIYFFVVMLIFEFCRLAISTTYWDLAIAESVRIAKNNDSGTHNYAEIFEKALLEQKRLQDSSTMGYLAQLEKNKFEVKVQYVDCADEKKCVSALLNGQFRQPQKGPNGEMISPNGQNATLAHYTLKYEYNFVNPLPFIPKSWSESILNREFVVVQEYERSKFSF